MAAPLALLAPALKALAAQGGRAAVTGAAKNIAKDALKNKAKDFVTGKKKKKGKRGALVKSKGGEVTREGEQGGGSLVATTPMVGNYRVETPPDKPDTEGKPSQVSFESINNQLESIVALTEVLKKTSMSKLKTSDNRRKAERKAAEKAKKRDKESLLERGAGFIGGAIGGAVSKSAPFDPLKFFTMIFLGSLLLWITKNGSKIIGFLKAGLAFFNNFGKLLKAGFGLLGKGIKAGLKAIGSAFPKLGKLGKSIKGIFTSAGKMIKGALSGIGNGLKNLAKGIIKKLKDLGKFMMNPQGKKPPKGTPKGLQKSAKSASKTGELSNNARRILKKHGPEAAERYQRLVDNGMDPAKASRQVNKSIKAGKIVSKPAAQAGSKAGSKVAQKAGEKSLVTVSKGALRFLKRIPVIGGLITLVVSLLSGDPISQALFKTGGAVLGGFLGSFIPIPVIGTLLGELVGEYIGDLMYHLLMGGGPEAVGEKMKKDIEGLLKVGTAAINWAKDGFGRLYEGLPRINLFGVKGLVNFPSLLLNPLQVVPTVYKSFFTRDPMKPGKETTQGEPEQIEYQTGVTTPSTGPGAAPPEPDYSQEPTVGRRPTITSTGATVSAANITPNMSRKDKFMMIYNAAVAAGDPMPALSAAQSMFETGFLTSELSLKANNPYGQTGRGDAGYYDYRNASENTKWALYSSYNAAIKHHVKRWSTKTPQGNPGYATYDNPMDAMRGIIENYAPAKDANNHAHYLGGVEAILKEMGFDPNAPEKPQVQSTATTPQVQPTTPMAMASPPLAGQGQSGVAPTIEMVPGTITTPQTTPSIQDPPPAPAPTGTGLTNVVPTANLMAPGIYAGENAIQNKVGFTSGRGMRWGKMHRGVDIGVGKGNKGYYVALKLNGKVSDVGSFSGYGKTVVITSGGKDFLFAHLARTMVQKGQSYNGEIIGEIGNTGAGTGEHLHFEVSPAGTGGYQQDEDPMPYVKYLAIGRMGDGSPVGTNNTTPDLSIQDPSTASGSTTTAGGSVTTGSGSVTVTRSSTAGGGSVSSISSQLPYEVSGGGGVIMMTHPSGRTGGAMGGKSTGTPVIMGSGDVVNSYYKSQLLGFLYKQG